MIINKLEAGIRSFAGLTPGKETIQKEKYTRLYQERSSRALDDKRFWETGKELGFGVVAGILAGIGIYALTDAFEHGRLIEAVAGAGVMLLSLALARSMIRADDNNRLLNELPMY